MSDSGKKKKKGGKWFPPREQRGDYKMRKRYPHAVDVASAHATMGSGLFVKTDIRNWLVAEVGDGMFGYAIGSDSVTFRFKDEKDMDRFTGFIDAQ